MMTVTSRFFFVYFLIENDGRLRFQLWLMRWGSVEGKSLQVPTWDQLSIYCQSKAPKHICQVNHWPMRTPVACLKFVPVGVKNRKLKQSKSEVMLPKRFTFSALEKSMWTKLIFFFCFSKNTCISLLLNLWNIVSNSTVCCSLHVFTR